MSELSKMLSELQQMRLSTIVETETQTVLSPEEFKSKISTRATLLKEKYKLEKGHCVFLLEYNNIDFFTDFLALWTLDVTAIPVDPTLKDTGLKELSDKIKPNLIISKIEIVFKHSQINKNLESICLVLFTSGSTSSPKGVLISKSSFSKKMEIMKHYIPANEIENALCFIPTYFGHGLLCNGLYCLFNSKKFFIGPKMNLDFASKFSGFLKKYEISFFSSVPSHWELILGLSGKREDGDMLKRVHCASAPLLSEKIDPILEWLDGVPFYDIYGATEMLGWFAHRRVLNSFESTSFNDFWEVDKKISAEKELILYADYMFDGYWNGEQVEPILEFNSGDIFEGNKLVGRSKNVIIKNGQKIHTDDLNVEILKSQLVQDVAAFPVDDRFSGETVGVFVVLKPGVLLEDFKLYCRKNLNSLSVPHVYVTVHSIPVNSRGKGSLNLLKKAYRDIGQ